MRCVLIALIVACSAEAATYRGIERSDAWVDRAYLHFRTRVASVEAAWVDVSMPDRFVTKLPPLTAARVYCRADRIVPDGILVVVGRHDRSELAKGTRITNDNPPSVFSSSGQRLLLVGVDPPSRGKTFAAIVIAVGKASGGVYRCVEMPRKLEPLTREQFLAALASGFRLYEWRETRKRVGGGIVPAYTQRLVP